MVKCVFKTRTNGVFTLQTLFRSIAFAGKYLPTKTTTGLPFRSIPRKRCTSEKFKNIDHQTTLVG